LRQDHLGCYGYQRDTSPNLDRFSLEEAITFESAFAQSTYTLPSHMSMLTGLYPETHGILLPFPFEAVTTVDHLADNVTTFAEALKSKGYITSAFTDGLLVGKKYGFDQGFDEYRDERKSAWIDNGLKKHRDELNQWIRKNRDEDFFLFIHSYDTHMPYVVEEPFASKFDNEPVGRKLPPVSMQHCALVGAHDAEWLKRFDNIQEIVNKYDGCISFVDDELGKLFDLLKELDLFENSLIIVTSDHGESFMENGLLIGHGLSATNEQTVIPLLVKLPGSAYAGQRIDHTVESIDIMPTVLSALDIPTPIDVQGQNLLAGLENGRWSKDFAFGVVPQTGCNYYFIHNGIKYIEAVYDPSNVLLKAGVRPLNPPMFNKPDKPYCSLAGKSSFYNFKDDPLGVSELFHRGDRAYKLKPGRFEWNSKMLQDVEVLKQYKKAAYSVAARSMDIGKKFQNKNTKPAILSQKECEQLQKIGYGGIIASTKLRKIKVGKRDKSLSLLVLKPPFTDRILLAQGDDFLWRLKDAGENPQITFEQKAFRAELKNARSKYIKFKYKHPEKSRWVEWRLKYLSKLAKEYMKSRNLADEE